MVVVLIELAEQEIESHLLRALAVFSCYGKIGYCLGKLFVFDEIVGKGEVAKRTYALVFNLVEVYVGEHIVGLGGPPHSAVAQHFPHLCLCHEVGFPGEMACNVVECGGGAEEIAFHVLGLAHEIPCVVQEWVIFVTFQPLLVLWVVSLAVFALWLLFNGVQRNCFLHFLDCAVEVC